MQAVIVIKTRNGYAVAPFSGEVAASAISEMSVAEELSSYSYGSFTVLKALQEAFEPKPVVPLKEAA